MSISLDVNKEYGKRVRFADSSYTYNSNLTVRYGASTAPCYNVKVYLMVSQTIQFRS